MVNTLGAYWNELQAYSNGISLDFSPEDNTFNEVLISDFGNADGLVVAFTGLLSESANMLYRLDR